MKRGGLPMASTLEERTINTIERPWGAEARFEPSPRRVRVRFGNTLVADSQRVMLLLEPKKLGIYYFPQDDVRMDLLTRAGERLWTVKVGDRDYQDIVWSYSPPIPECTRIDNLLAFYNEKVDIIVDGEKQAKPKTPWS